MTILSYIILLFTLLPLPALAFVNIANCDRQAYRVTVNNGGEVRVKNLPPYGVIQEYGPIVRFRVGEGPMTTAQQPDSEYCVREGVAKLQRLYLTNSNSGFR